MSILSPHLRKFSLFPTNLLSKRLLRAFLSDSSSPNNSKTAVYPPYLETSARIPNLKKKIFIETYGCQMNYNDSEIVISILNSSGSCERVNQLEDADIVLIMTCAIREAAESKIWNRLEVLNSLERRKRFNMKIGILGCMAERLKHKLLEHRGLVDVVCGPDAYRDLPRLLDESYSGIQAINVMLSADETYADISPVRLDGFKKSAFVSIMRGCNNMCAFCIVPYTRGRERSRPLESIINEIKLLSSQGIREVTLLGQNVNSYCDETTLEFYGSSEHSRSAGFTSTCKTIKKGARFADLLEKVSAIDKEMRIRFTSPHPKDFPDELLYLMRERHNLCKQIHLPAQSGSTKVLESMNRGYSREAYLQLVEHIRSILPNVSLSSDFIAGFCGETEEDHLETVDLIKKVGYDMAYMFAYSLREKTKAHRRLVDDVSPEVKQARLAEIISTFYHLLYVIINPLCD